jgi:tetratricopeptide (TPR) repeat protein
MILFALLLLAQDIATLSAEGAAAMRAKQYPAAIRTYQALVTQDATNPMWRLNLGMALFYAADHTGSAQALEHFIRIKPQPGPAHLFLGVARLNLKQPCEAIAPLEVALQWPQRPQSRWTELADAYQGCKRWEPAAKAYAEAALLAPTELQLARQSAHCWRMARRYDLAKPIFASLTSSYASSAEFHFEYGDTLTRLEGAEAGLSWLEKSVAADPKLLPAQAALGRALMELNRPADALPHLEIASKTDPALLLPLSRAYRTLGRTEEATRTEAEYKSRITMP